MMFQYFVKVVPTVYMKVDGEVSTFFPLLLWQMKAFRLPPYIQTLTLSDLWWKQRNLLDFHHVTTPTNTSFCAVMLSVVLQQR